MWLGKLIENFDVFPESSLTDDEADDSGVSDWFGISAEASLFPLAGKRAGGAEGAEPSYGASGAAEGEDQTPSPGTPGAGISGDIAELGETMASGLAGLTSLLRGGKGMCATPAQEPPAESSPGTAAPGSLGALAGARMDINVFKDTFATELSRMALTLLPVLDPADENKDVDSKSDDDPALVVGFTDKVRGFASEIAQHPQTWIDFPLADAGPFELSEAQREHTEAARAGVPALEHLRRRLVPSKMPEGHFWRVYFILLHSRLQPEHAGILSTPHILDMRASVIADLRSSVGSLSSVEAAEGDPTPAGPPPVRPLLDASDASDSAAFVARVPQSGSEVDPEDADWAADVDSDTADGSSSDLDSWLAPGPGPAPASPAKGAAALAPPPPAPTTVTGWFSGREDDGASEDSDEAAHEDDEREEEKREEKGPAPVLEGGREKEDSEDDEEDEDEEDDEDTPPRIKWSFHGADDPDSESAEIAAAGFVEVKSPSKPKPARPPRDPRRTPAAVGVAAKGVARTDSFEMVAGMGSRSESYEMINNAGDEDDWEEV